MAQLKEAVEARRCRSPTSTPSFSCSAMPAVANLITRGERRAHLDAMCRLLLEHGDTIAAAIDADFGHRSVHETKILEIFPRCRREACEGACGEVDAAERKSVSVWFMPAAHACEQPLGRGRHHRALELSALSRCGAADLGARGGQPGDGQDVRVHARPC